VYGLTESGQRVAELARQRLADTQRVLSEVDLGDLDPSGAKGA
jgi:hypothetical protein